MTTRRATIEAGYAACERETRRRAGNFWLGIRLLPTPRRRALSAVYWFSERADRAVDGDGDVDARRARLSQLRSSVEATLDGQAPDSRWLAFEDATRRYAIPTTLYHQLLDGVARDLEPAPLEDWDAVLEYCYGVASVVGLIALRIFGGRSASEPAAIDLGYALQLTNILRDVREDARRGRWYLPLELTRRFGVTPAAVADGRAEHGFVPLILSVAEGTRDYYHAGSRLYAQLPRSTRACPAALAGVYRGLLERIAADPLATLDGPVRLPAVPKLGWGLGRAAAALLS